MEEANIKKLKELEDIKRRNSPIIAIGDGYCRTVDPGLIYSNIVDPGLIRFYSNEIVFTS